MKFSKFLLKVISKILLWVFGLLFVTIANILTQQIETHAKHCNRIFIYLSFKEIENSTKNLKNFHLLVFDQNIWYLRGLNLIYFIWIFRKTSKNDRESESGKGFKTTSDIGYHRIWLNRIKNMSWEASEVCRRGQMINSNFDTKLHNLSGG